MAVLVRLAAAEDAAALAAVYRPFVEDSRISFEEAAPDAAEMARRIADDGRGLFAWLVAEEDGRLLGFVNSSPFRARAAYRWAVETGIYLAADAHGRGIGGQLLARMLDLLTAQGFTTAIAGIALPNPASVALHEKLGFKLTGTYDRTGFKHGQWLDVGHWQRDLAPRAETPAGPRPFAEVF
ncbi:N-acetyltransferase family protein [Sphingomonas sp.]|uniref:GNAT family N-acetyltransferase n=1 Tax=Sphingomonas sp. TaxID=28214 RepID=UPI00286E84E0|nr:N-acetyltransferase family protein [Sphingomonas sp.]